MGINNSVNLNFPSLTNKTVSANKIRESYFRQNKNPSFFVKFEGLPVRDEINNTLCFVRGVENPSFDSGVSGKALRMRPQSGIDIPINIIKRDKFSLSFWLKSVWLKPAVNILSGESDYYRMSLINWSNISLNNINKNYEAATGFCIFEESLDEEYNRIYLWMEGNDGSKILLRSINSYKTNIYHHFYFAYSGASRSIILFINGKKEEMEFVEGNEIPQIMAKDNLTPNYIEINSSAIGYSGLVRNNFGTLDEIYFSNDYNSSSEIVARHINFGSEFVAFSGLYNQDQSIMMFGFDDPSSIKITSIFSNGTNIYAGRSDGRIYKGDRLLWRTRKDFSNSDEINFIKKNYLTSDSSVSIDDGSLKIVKSIVRL